MKKSKSLPNSITTDASLTISKIQSGRVQFTWYIPSAADCHLAPTFINSPLRQTILDLLSTHTVKGYLDTFEGDITVSSSGATIAELLIRYWLRTQLLWPGAGRKYQSRVVDDLSIYAPKHKPLPYSLLVMQKIEELRKVDENLLSYESEYDQLKCELMESASREYGVVNDWGRFFREPNRLNSTYL